MHQLSVHNVHLRIADCENVAFQISRTRGLSFDCKEETVFGVHKTDAATVHCGVRHGTKVNDRPKLVAVVHDDSCVGQLLAEDGLILHLSVCQLIDQL